MSLLSVPPAHDPEATVAWVAEHLGDLALEGPGGIRSGAFRGGQSAADAALATLDVTGYARDRNTVLPEARRGASRMSPYVRHGLLPLRAVWDAAAGAPPRDRAKYRDELLWQEYARHLYARVGADLGRPLRREQPRVPEPWENPWPRDMACMDHAVGSLEDDGWVVNQQRMWLASQWSVRAGAAWRDGEDLMFRHLLDGSRAANRLGWQWTVGTGSKPYGFSRWQVQKRSPQLCRSCALSEACPVEDWPDDATGAPVDGPDLRKGPVPGGPGEADGSGGERVWLTAESLGTGDPALAAEPDRPAVFCFDEPLLRRLRLSGKRLVFLAETLGELAEVRDLDVRRGAVVDELAGAGPLAATYAPVPGYQRRRRQLDVVEEHPWPWLVTPRVSAVGSFSAWRKTARP